MTEKLKKIKIDIISLILAIICPYFLGIVGIGISIVFLILYTIYSKKHPLLLFLYFVGIIFIFGGLFLLGNMKNTGIDAIGEALVYGAMTTIGYTIAMICPLVIIFVDNKKLIFRKKNLKVVAILVIAVCLYFVLHILLTTIKVSNNIPTVGDLKEELNKRGFLTSTTNYKLYGIEGSSKKAIALSFEQNFTEKYPLYVFAIIDYPWLIYYANGDMYAVRGKYWDYCVAYNKCNVYNEEKIIWDYGETISETEEITVYNTKLNRYKKGSNITYVGFNYYSQNEDIENSIFVDIPSIESWGKKVKQIDKIDISSLNKL